MTFSSKTLKPNFTWSRGGKKDEAHVPSRHPHQAHLFRWGKLGRWEVLHSGEGLELRQSQGQVPRCLGPQRRTPSCRPLTPPAVLSACDSFRATRCSPTTKASQQKSGCCTSPCDPYPSFQGSGSLVFHALVSASCVPPAASFLLAYPVLDSGGKKGDF